MSIFNSSSSVVGNAALENAIHAVVRELIQIDSPRSLSEIRTDEDDFEWLSRWAGRLTPSRLQIWLDERPRGINPYSSKSFNLTQGEAFGVLFLLLASESARRNAIEGQIWPVVYPLFSQQAQRILFDFQNQPKPVLKDALVSATDKLKLRHVFGMEGTQEYYISTYLQFGFTQKGIGRLAHWLAGQAETVPIQHLTGGSGISLRSESFLDLWETLKNYRRNNITEEQARRTIESSPWVLPSWCEEILRQSKQHLYLDTADTTSQVEELETLSEFLALPRLHWDGATPPNFRSSVRNLSSLDLDEDVYQIKVGADVLAQLTRTEGGSYLPLPGEVNVPTYASSITAEIMSEKGESIESQFIELWDPMEDVELFDLRTGRRSLDAWTQRLTSGREYAVLISTDLDNSPSELHFQIIGSGNDVKRLVRFVADVDNPVRVSLKEQELWTSDERSVQPRTEDEPRWTRAVAVQMRPTNKVVLSEDPTRRLYVYGLPGDAELTFVRISSMPLNYSRDAGVYITEEFNITGFASQLLRNTEFPVRLGLRMKNAQGTVVTRTLVLDVSGVLDVTRGRRDVIDPSGRLSVRDASQTTFRYIVPTRYLEDLPRMFVMQGDMPVGKFPRRPRQLNGLSGDGSKVWVSDKNQLYEVLTIAESTYDPGIVKGSLSRGDGLVRLYLESDLEPDELHQIVIWKPGYSPDIRAARSVVSLNSSSLSDWDIAVGGAFSDDIYVAIAYEGIRLGAKLPQGPVATGHITQENALETFALLRWMQAPVLSPEWQRPMVELINDYTVEARQAWHEDMGLHNVLKQRPMNGDWITLSLEIQRAPY